jgi:hypothetical protein
LEINLTEEETEKVLQVLSLFMKEIDENQVMIKFTRKPDQSEEQIAVLKKGF